MRAFVAAARAAGVFASLCLAACGKEDPKFFFEKKPIPELPYQGFRRDIPNERRGNGTFTKAVFTNDGRYLITLGKGIHVWDAETGALLSTMRASLDGNDPLVVDGARHRLLAKRGDIAPHLPEAAGYWIWNWQDGSRQGPIPEGAWPAHRTSPVGFTPEGEPVVIADGRIEVWQPDGSTPRVRIDAPAGRRFCTLFDPIVHEKQCAELSRSGRWLAVIDQDTTDHNAVPGRWLADLEHGTLRRITLPDSVRALSGGISFAFSPDERSLAMQLTDGMWIGYPVEGPAAPEASGRFVRGEHQRNLFLIPIAYTEDGARIVALGDQMTFASYDASTGALVGRSTPPFEEREGALRVAANGSRAIAYRYIADILVVVDGATGAHRGYVCPYFCNRAHNPVALPYAVSPDGRRIASGGRLGAGLWDTDADTLIAPLVNPSRPPLEPR